MQNQENKYIAIDGLFHNRRLTAGDIRMFQKFLLNPEHSLNSIYAQFLMRIALPEQEVNPYHSLKGTNLSDILIDAFCWSACNNAECSVDRLLKDTTWFCLHEKWNSLLDDIESKTEN